MDERQEIYDLSSLIIFSETPSEGHTPAKRLINVKLSYTTWRQRGPVQPSVIYKYKIILM